LKDTSQALLFNFYEGAKVMKWLFLIIAGACEVGWAIGLKYSQGFTKLVPSILTVSGMIASFYFLSLTLKELPLGTTYAIWTGIGTVGTVILGIILFKEPIDAIRLICIGFIVTGIIGLKLVSPH
jgi:quaternary ammonium compound-resistance protein SugE